MPRAWASAISRSTVARSPNTGSTSQWSLMSNPWSRSGERKNGPTHTAETPSVLAR